MKVVGNKEDVNRIELSHKGLNVSFNCSMKSLPYDYNIDISKPKTIEIIFKDSYEIEALIDVLEKFKKECFGLIGEWRQYYDE